MSAPDYDHEYYVRYRDRILSQQKQYRQTNQAKVSAQRRGRYRRDIEKLRVARKIDYWKNRERRKAQKAASTYGISFEEAGRLLALPCGICGRRGRVSLDHDHKTGRVRGPLCQKCNSFIGYLESSNGTLKLALEWIQKGGLS